ncbi:MAG TPA: ribosome-associated translation inhibitor RaiA [Patescibacteria group bacterium]|jgi:putative sigma-54 modulation protein|nr:ribosome-associated translation inhibitor RaiA [Patescibacteria group bacterium]
MAINIDKSGINLELEDDLKKYIDKKIGRLSRYVQRSARKSLYIEVKIHEVNEKSGNKYMCEVVMHLPGERVIAKESTINMFAAVDIVEAKLKNQLRSYKETHIAHLRERRRGAFKRLAARFLARSDDDNRPISKN